MKFRSGNDQGFYLGAQSSIVIIVIFYFSIIDSVLDFYLMYTKKMNIRNCSSFVTKCHQFTAIQHQTESIPLRTHHNITVNKCLPLTITIKHFQRQTVNSCLGVITSMQQTVVIPVKQIRKEVTSRKFRPCNPLINKCKQQQSK